MLAKARDYPRAFCASAPGWPPGSDLPAMSALWTGIGRIRFRLSLLLIGGRPAQCTIT